MVPVLKQSQYDFILATIKNRWNFCYKFAGTYKTSERVIDSRKQYDLIQNIFCFCEYKYPTQSNLFSKIWDRDSFLANIFMLNEPATGKVSINEFDLTNKCFSHFCNLLLNINCHLNLTAKLVSFWRLELIIYL